eukprot:TRINITY_DN61578_c0_g1_i1.p1 TRINITY_DN61578_c0_g1~~TRINITY_DN61578_c0_g1_i1.p1  ORF type:complete len:248 (-),score=22.43 TRINITY_DN61578_c0_g1_i1:140-883(-)
MPPTENPTSKSTNTGCEENENEKNNAATYADNGTQSESSTVPTTTTTTTTTEEASAAQGHSPTSGRKRAIVMLTRTEAGPIPDNVHLNETRENQLLETRIRDLERIVQHNEERHRVEKQCAEDRQHEEMRNMNKANKMCIEQMEERHSLEMKHLQEYHNMEMKQMDKRICTMEDVMRDMKDRDRDRDEQMDIMRRDMVSMKETIVEEKIRFQEICERCKWLESLLLKGVRCPLCGSAVDVGVNVERQ